MRENHMSNPCGHARVTLAILCIRGKIRLARETIPCGSIISMDCWYMWYNKKRLISTDAALHKIHVQYYMKVRMLQCKYFIKCIYMECCYEVKIVHFFCW